MSPSSVQRCLLAGALGALALAAAAPACTIPVFRFALDRWPADPFRLVIPASRATEPELMELLVPLRGNGEANLRVVEEEDSNNNGARLAFPFDETTVWRGQPDAAALAGIIDSPARRELLRRILAGDSVVWVVVAGQTDRAEAERIERRLRYLEQVAALPVQDPLDPDSQLGPGPPLRLKFSVLRVAPDDPAERLFAAMLAGPRQQAWLTDGTAFAAPVFGRGRVLGAWPARDLDDTAIEDATLFLIGRCSCRVKNESPGWDLVLRVDWEQALARAAAGEDPGQAAPTAGEAAEPGEPADPTTPQTGGEPVTATTHAAPDPPPVPPAMNARVAWPVVAGGLAAVACAVAGLALWFRH